MRNFSVTCQKSKCEVRKAEGFARLVMRIGKKIPGLKIRSVAKDVVYKNYKQLYGRAGLI